MESLLASIMGYILNNKISTLLSILMLANIVGFSIWGVIHKQETARLNTEVQRLREERREVQNDLDERLVAAGERLDVVGEKAAWTNGYISCMEVYAVELPPPPPSFE